MKTKIEGLIQKLEAFNEHCQLWINNKEVPEELKSHSRVEYLVRGGIIAQLKDVICEKTNTDAPISPSEHARKLKELVLKRFDEISQDKIMGKISKTRRYQMIADETGYAFNTIKTIVGGHLYPDYQKEYRKKNKEIIKAKREAKKHNVLS